MTEGHTERLEAALDGKYLIERKLGEGGMATVYLAQDVKHERKVALKILKPELAAVIGAERFLSEIKTTANLQHPHILALFDSGEASGYLYYVMPYIEGETLREKLDREKQLGVEESVRIARDVADALDYAHRQGVIHRDIKPGNILLHDGRPVVADFGIALAVSAAGGGRMTETGLSLGTPHYMSPEQASADRDLSARSDIYSLGCVLYEMIGGQPPHTGPSAQSILVHILTEEATPLTKLRHTVPPHVAATVSKAIEKLPADRFETAKAFMEALGDEGFTYWARPATGTATSGSHVTPMSASTRRWLRDGRSVVALTVGVAMTVVAAWALLRPGPAPPVSRYSIALPPEQAFAVTTTGISGLALSPEGEWFVYTGVVDGVRQLWLRPQDQLVATPLPGTDGALNPAVSPDGSKVAFVTGPGIHRMRLMVSTIGGGPPLLIQDSLVDAGGVSWGYDGYIYYDGFLEGDGIARVPEAGGSPQPVTMPRSADGELWHNAPHALPNGKGLVFGVYRGQQAMDVGVVDLESGEHRILVPGAIGARYSPTGHLVYVSEAGALIAHPFDQDRLELTGDPEAIIDGIQTGDRGSAQLALAPDGTMMYVASDGGAGLGAMVWIARDGVPTEIDPDSPAAEYSNPALSPDGGQLAITVREGGEPQVWVKQLPEGRLARFTTEGLNDAVAWTADGRALGFRSAREGGVVGWYQQPSDGSAPPELVLDVPGGPWASTYSQDGHWMVYASNGDLFGIMLDSLGGVLGEPTELRVGQALESRPALSPDGRWLAYQSGTAGPTAVYVCPFPTCDVTYPISPTGGQAPGWARDGSELFYVDAVSLMLIAVEVGPGTPATWSGARELFSVEGLRWAGARPFDISPGDERFVMVRQQGGREAVHLVLVQNFAEVLRQRMGEN